MSFSDLFLYAEFVAKLLGGVCILATIVVRITPNKKDDSYVKKFNSKYEKFIAFLPTLGMNPNTKKLIDTVEEYQKELPADEGV